MIRQINVMIALIFLVAANAHAGQDPHPPVNKKSIIGVWEGRHESVVYVYRLAMLSHNEGRLVAVSWAETSTLYDLVSCKISNGKVEMEFSPTERDDATEKKLVLRAQGVAPHKAQDDGGVLKGEIETLHVDDSTTTEKITLYKGEHFEQYWRMSQAGKLALRKGDTH